MSESEAVAVLDTVTGEKLAYLPVGDHPQRVRLGMVPEELLDGDPGVAPTGGYDLLTTIGDYVRRGGPLYSDDPPGQGSSSRG